jgi:hypothetical protein
MMTTSGAGSSSSRTVAAELIAHERIRAYKMGGKTMIDSVDEYHASLPRIETRAC